MSLRRGNLQVSNNRVTATFYLGEHHFHHVALTDGYSGPPSGTAMKSLLDRYKTWRGFGVKLVTVDERNDVDYFKNGLDVLPSFGFDS